MLIHIINVPNCSELLHNRCSMIKKLRGKGHDNKDV